MEKTIYNLELHETLWVDEIKANVTRVESGWLYKYEREVYVEKENYYKNEIYVVIFVPYNNGSNNRLDNIIHEISRLKEFTGLDQF
jgi:hypothetical protein